MGLTMIFHTFATQDERREYNGSAFMEIQPCLLPEGTEIIDNTATFQLTWSVVDLTPRYWPDGLK